MRANSAEQQYIDRATAHHVYEQDIDAVFPDARKLLFQEGYQVRETSETSLETEYLRGGEYATRYLVTATREDRGWRVHFTRDRLRRDSDTADVRRDFDFEWKLIQRVDAKAAERIRRDAEAAGSTARQN